MNKSSFSVSLPFKEVIRRSFGYVFGHFDSLVKISAVWFLAVWGFDILTGFPSLCNLDNNACLGTGKQSLFLLVISLASFAVVIAYIRCIVLRIAPEKYAPLSFGKRELRYIAKALVLGVIIAIPAFLLGFMTGFVGTLLQFEPNVSIRLSLVAAFICLVFGLRLYLVFPATAVDDTETNFKKSFEITKGNTNKIFWGFVAVTLPGVVSFVVLALLYQSLASDMYLIKMIFASLVLLVSFIDVGLKASYLAHLYQYFTYFYQKWQKEEKK